MQFIGIVKQVTAKSLVSGDRSFRVLLETEDVHALEAGSIPGDQVVKVTIEPSS